MRRPFFSTFDFAAVFVCLLIVAHEVRKAQFTPRHLVTTLNGRVMSDLVLTNPEYVTWHAEPYLTSNGFAYRQVPSTNLLWTQWNFWR